MKHSIAPPLFILFIVFWLLLAINPLYRNIWIAENIVLLMGIIYLVSSYKSLAFTNRAYMLIFLFCILQTVGAHYTYAEVPLGFWVADWLDIQRNHYDRLVHFMFGFLLVFPVREIMNKTVKFANQQMEILILVLLFLGLGGFYEILEWLYALLYEHSEATDSFLGSQGDIWDAEKDVLLAGLGAWLYLLVFKTKSEGKPNVH
ncbi:Predicted membrane protein [uncultured Candidatus Thioglobus sp.]|nr:Predicted membrane protein [uncultured Candidatus Thioglobus sp.]